MISTQSQNTSKNNHNPWLLSQRSLMTASIPDQKSSIQQERAIADEPERAEDTLARNQIKERLGLQQRSQMQVRVKQCYTL